MKNTANTECHVIHGHCKIGNAIQNPTKPINKQTQCSVSAILSNQYAPCCSKYPTAFSSRLRLGPYYAPAALRIAVGLPLVFSQGPHVNVDFAAAGRLAGVTPTFVCAHM